MLGFRRSPAPAQPPEYEPALRRLEAQQQQLRADVARLTDHVTRIEALLCRIDRWAARHIERWPGDETP